MRWRGGRRSQNVEDRRGSGGNGGGGGGFRFPFPRGGRGGRRMPIRRSGMGGIGMIIVIVLVLLFGGDLGSLFDQSPIAPSGNNPGSQTFPQLPDVQGRNNQPGRTSQTNTQQSSDDAAAFISVVLADTEDTWKALFQQFGQTYREPRLVLFEGVVRSACGTAQSAMGPFYCPGDQKVYIDLSFFNDLSTRFGAPGDFAQAYVIAHEIGHHVQTLLGVSERVRAAQSGAGQSQSNAIQVRMELQADCFAGIWAHHADNARHILEDGDVEEAMNAAKAIGDDRLQRQSQGRVVPDSFTHGTSEQRMRWFSRGLESGNLRDCDTFNASQI
ncbi:MAG: neutral zinc metallopeptidase [Rhizobiales bacterium]|nr:neutral zinc metallopeptidase [Hyphomicrobiales bacterium]